MLQQLVRATLCWRVIAGEAVHMAPVDPDVLKPAASKQCRSVGLHNNSLAFVVLAVVLNFHMDGTKRFDAFAAVRPEYGRRWCQELLAEVTLVESIRDDGQRRSRVELHFHQRPVDRRLNDLGFCAGWRGGGAVECSVLFLQGVRFRRSLLWRLSTFVRARRLAVCLRTGASDVATFATPATLHVLALTILCRVSAVSAPEAHVR